MPIRMKTWRDEFSWLTDQDGNPYSPVYELGAVEKPIYYAQCALCGCIHELRHDQPPRGVYEPLCLLIEFVYQGGSQLAQWRALLDDWQGRYPESTNHRRVHLLPIAEIPKPMPLARPGVLPGKAVARVRRYSKPQEEAA